MTSQPNSVQASQDDIQGSFLHLPALEVRQGDGSTLYSFAVDGKQLALFATISRVHRHDDSEIQGYQRPAVLSHINAIRRYIESDSPMIPNALVVAFDKRVQFEPLSDAPHTAYARHGTLASLSAGTPKRGEAGMDSGRPAAHRGHPGRPRRKLPHLCYRIHRGIG